MIAFLTGEIINKFSDRVYISVCGVGYEVQVSLKTLDKIELNKKTDLFIYTHFSQDMVALYGFLNMQEKNMFLRLLGVTKVGPKVALSALSTFSAEELATAIVIGDANALEKISGLGKKTAQRVILELKEKISSEEIMESQQLSIDYDESKNESAEAVSALMALGYDGATAKMAVMKAAKEYQNIEDIIKAALKSLAKT